MTDRLKVELRKALEDDRYRSLSSLAAGDLTRDGRYYLRKQAEKIALLTHEYDLHMRILRIKRGEVFSLFDIDQCRREIMLQYPEYENPITASSGVIFAAEAIRRSFGKRFYLILYRNPICLDMGTPDHRLRVVHPSNFIEYRKIEERKE